MSATPAVCFISYVSEGKKGGIVHDDQKGNEKDRHDLQMQKLLLNKIRI